MLQDRICKECGRTFRGGPRAYYCPSCRAERTKRANAAYRSRKRAGNVRPIGSYDKCKRCGKNYIVEGGLQRFCPDCQPVHAAEYDKETAIQFYHTNKDKLNPARNERRRIGEAMCAWCGKIYPKTNSSLTCSQECRRQLKNKQWREIYGPRYVSKNKSKDSPKT